MNIEEARNILVESTAQVDWINLGFILSTLGEQGYSWRKYDGAFFKPHFNRSLVDMKWLDKNSERLNQALNFIKDAK
jgi:hypothetical protein